MQTQDLNNTSEGSRPTRDQVNDWLRDQILCVLSTLDESGAPMGATVAFSVTDNGRLLIGTSESSRKSHNLDHDNRVAMVVTDSDARITVQLEGTAEKLDETTFEQTYADEHFRQRPESLPFRDKPGQCHILVTPTHLRFSDVSVNPWVLTEFDS